MLNLKSVFLFLILFLLSITDTNAAVAFTRLFVVMVSIVGAIENRIKNKNISKPKKPKKISKTDVPLIKSIQEFKKLKKNNFKHRIFNFLWKYFYRLKEFFRKKS